MEKKIIKYLRSRGNDEPTEKDIDLYYKGFLKETQNMKILQGKNKENENAVFIDEFYKRENEYSIAKKKCENK